MSERKSGFEIHLPSHATKIQDTISRLFTGNTEYLQEAEDGTYYLLDSFVENISDKSGEELQKIWYEVGQEFANQISPLINRFDFLNNYIDKLSAERLAKKIDEVAKNVKM